MINSKGERELAYLVRINNIESIIGSDNCEAAIVNGWHVLVSKGEFKPNDIAVFFEVDSKLPEVEPFISMEFLKSKHYKIKTQKFTFGGKGNFVSQGLLMPFSAFIDREGRVPHWLAAVNLQIASGYDVVNTFLTEEIGVTYAVSEDNERKARSIDKYKKMAQRNQKIAKTFWWKWLYGRSWGKKVLFLFFGKKRDIKTDWPVGRFPGVSKTDQERAENMVWILQDKTPFIRTQKCDGSSGTYILERVKRHKYEFYVCSRNVRMMKEDQECFFGSHNYYWEVANKYRIEEKMKDFLERNIDVQFVCWQGEICAPGIQGNPHDLTETHFYCFHCTDSKTGRWNIRDAQKMWKSYNMEVVPIDEEDYIMPDDFEDFKQSADGKYDASVCEGKDTCQREGYVYYKTTDPTFSFKNVSREYLLKH